ncbi:hypothetical protein QMK33_19020 [Hymenobacter sp. H14-R3]|uniref:hypothetical protein n=1 Tax=Hymenobacter sp. H14-R3 TaxID=3046308 RepID=UPI0024BBEA64|nr:hypothetical protein [Hymenobacter sp. H14-R3]MDJ0367246.1 hypothetical protein [Hymenobacter sp. H14-R3]
MKNFYALGLLLSALGASAQRPIYQPIDRGQMTEYAALPKQPLLVVLPEEIKDPKVLRKKYQKPADLAAYQAEVAATRTCLESAAKYWTLSETKFITPAEASQLEDDIKQGHLLLEMGVVSSELSPTANNRSPTLATPSLMLRWVGKMQKPSAGHVLLAIAGGGSLFPGKSRLAAFQSFYYSYKSTLMQNYHTSDFISTVQQMQAYVQQRAQGQEDKEIEKATKARVGKNAPLLKSKTLLLDRMQLSENLPEAKIAKLYPYPVQVTDRATVEAAVAAADPRYLYVRYVTVLRNNGYQLLDAATGQVASYAEFHMLKPTDLGKVQDSNLKEMYKTAVANSKESR